MKYVLSAIALLAFVGSADAATTTITITVSGAPSTSVACGTTSTYSLTAPAPGATVCPVTVQPTGWSGATAVTQTSGPTANAFNYSSGNIVVGSTTPAAGTYTLTITTTP